MMWISAGCSMRMPGLPPLRSAQGRAPVCMEVVPGSCVDPSRSPTGSTVWKGGSDNSVRTTRADEPT